MTYNYPEFDAYIDSPAEREEFSAFPNMLHAGTRAPDGEATMLPEGATVRLSDLWKDRGIVLEFGSFT